MNKIRKVTSFFPPTSKEVHNAAVAADSTKHKLTLLEQMEESRRKKIAVDKAKKEELIRLKALRDARLEENEEMFTPEKEVRDAIDDLATGK
jgi:hypothetical protein